MGFMDGINEKVANSKVGAYFKIKERNTTFSQELRGGLVTFLTICYILPVNSGILTDTGGPCISNGACPPGAAGFGTPACDDCLAETRSALIAATAASCVVSHFLMGALANLPLAVAPAMGLNAYFAYTVVGFMGTGRISYEQALTAVFMEGFIFIIISLAGVRTKLVELMPKSLLLATSAGIGLFLAHIGLQQGEGIGIVTYNSATLVTLGGCAPKYRSHQFTFPGPPNAPPNVSTVCGVGPSNEAVFEGFNWVPSGNYACASAGVMRSPTMWLGICSGLLMAILMAKGVKGSLIVGILFATFIAWIPTPSNRAAYIGDYSEMPGAVRRMEYFKKVAEVPNTSIIDASLKWDAFDNGSFWLALITFLYVDFFDATGTLFSMANMLGNYIPNFVDMKTKRFERQLMAYCVDGISIVVGSLLGTSPLTIYIESASGIREGARTGIAALVIMCCFAVALFFAPLIAAVPPYATGPALVLVGAMMMINVVKINWASVQDAVPAFITIALMPLTYSIAYGIIGGILCYVVINGGVFLFNYIHATAFPNSFDETAMAQGTPLKAAWYLTCNPPETTGMLKDEDFNGDSTVGVVKVDSPVFEDNKV